MPDFISYRASDNLDAIARIVGAESGRSAGRADRASAFTIEFKQGGAAVVDAGPLRLARQALPQRSVRSSPVDPGTMSWHEMRTPQPESSAGFLADLLDGDTATRARMSPGEYSTVLCDGLHVAGCARNSEGEQPGWQTFVRVPDVDLVCAIAVENGGHVAEAPHGIAGLDRRATIVDPTGAALTIIAGGDDRRTVGCRTLGWDELRSTDPMESVRFWCAVFRWSAEPVLGDHGARGVLFLNGGRPVASLREATPNEPRSRWIPVVTVRNELVRDTVRRAVLAGARLLVAPGPHGLLGASAVVIDPHGVEIAIGGMPA